MVEYEKYIKLPLKSGNREGFLIYLILVEILILISTIIGFIHNVEIGVFSGFSSIMLITMIYLTKYIKNLLENEDKLPKTEVFSKENFILFLKAIFTFILVFALFILLLYFLSWLLGFLETLLFILAILLLIGGSVIAWVSFIRTIDTDSIKEGLDIKMLFKIVASESFIIPIIFAFIFSRILSSPIRMIEVAIEHEIISATLAFPLSLLAVVPAAYGTLVAIAWITKAYQERINNL